MSRSPRNSFPGSVSRVALGYLLGRTIYAAGRWLLRAAGIRFF